MKQTEIGVIPEDWEVVNFNDEFNFLSTASYSRAEIQSQGEIGYIHYGDIHTKLNFHLDLNDYVSGYIKPEQIKTYSNIEVGDLIMADASEDYSGVGKAVEIIGKKDDIKVISGLHTFLIRAKKENRFALGFKGYFQNNPLIKKQYDALATGLKVYSLSKNSFKNIQIPLPPLAEQEAIANALSDADAWIEKLEQLIAKKRLIKQGGMQTLLTPKDDWEVKKLGEVLSYIQPTPYLVKSTEYSDKNSTPVLTAGKTFILGYTDEEFGIFDKLPTIIFDDFTTASKYVDFPFKAKSSAMKMLVLKDKNCDLRFLFDTIQNLKFNVGDHKRHWIGEFQNLEVLLPSLPEQERIATILSDMDAEIEVLEQQLDKARHIKQGMMQELLTGRTRLV